MTDTPVVGLGVTLRGYTDRYAGTIIEVGAKRKRIVVQQDAAIRVDENGTSMVQLYRYERDPQGAIYVFTLRSNGRWVLQGRSMHSPGFGVTLGTRDAYYDPSF